jgi:hypothetical protein
MRKYPFNGNPIVTNTFRLDPYNPHHGVDYAMPRRTAIFAVTHGKISRSVYSYPPTLSQSERQWLANTKTDPFKPVAFPLVKRALKTEDYGNFVQIDHGSTISTLYAHLDEVIVYEGQFVEEGELIGYSDSTGNSTGDHLHFEIRVNNKVVNPNTFDYSFTGKGGVNSKVIDKKDKVTVSVAALNVRRGPARTYERSGSMLIHKGNIIDVVGYVEGEEVSGNSIWYKSWKGNYFWAGGTNKPDPRLSEVAKKKDNMTPEQIEAKKQEFDARKAQLDATQKELDEKNVALEKEFEALDEAIEAYEADYAVFLADTTPVAPEEVAEEVAVEEEAPGEEVVEEAVEEVAEEAEVTLTEEEQNLFEKFKAKLGL